MFVWELRFIGLRIGGKSVILGKLYYRFVLWFFNLLNEINNDSCFMGLLCFFVMCYIDVSYYR